MKRTIAERMVWTLAATAVVVGAGWALADEGDHGKAGPAVKCPLMSEPIDPSMRLATDSGPMYFCCPGCVDKYKADPAKYAEKMAAQQKEIERLPKVQVSCPVTGEPVDGKIVVEKDGQAIHFCCPKCKAKYEEKPDEYARAVANSYTIQTTCPMDGKPIDPQASIEFTTGQKIYFCSPECAAKVKADVAAARPKLAEMNIFIDPATQKGA